MPISDNKVAAGDYTGYDIAGLSNTPSADGVSAADLKARFDALVKSVLVPKLNALIDGLGATTADRSGAANIGVETITGVTGADVQAVLEDLKTQIDSAALGDIPDGSLTDAKLSTDAAAILARFAAHVIDFATHFRYLGTTGGTATAYTATDAAFSFDTAKVNFLAIRANADCGASPTLNINAGGAKTIKPNGAATLTAGQMKQNGVYLLMWYPTTPATLYILNPETITLALTIGNVTGLQSALDGKAPSAHSHTIANVTSLQTTLDGKAAASHTHSTANVTGLDAALAGKAASSHTHTTANVTGLDTVLAGKAASSHTHSTAQVSGLDTALAGKAASSHNHDSSYLGIAAKAADAEKVDGHHVFVQASAPTALATNDIWIDI